MRILENLRKVKQKSNLPGGAEGREAWGTHLPNGRQRVLGRVVAAAAVGDSGNAVPGLEHLQGPAGGHRLKAEEAQQEVEAAGEEAGIERTTRYQQQQQQQEGEGAQEAPLFLPQPHAGARTGTDGSPGPAGLPGQESEKRGRKPKTLATERTLLGYQRRTMAAAAASGEGAGRPANQGGGSAGLGGGAAAMATEVGSGPRLTFQNSFGLFWSRDFNQGFSDSRRGWNTRAVARLYGWKAS